MYYFCQVVTACSSLWDNKLFTNADNPERDWHGQSPIGWSDRDCNLFGLDGLHRDPFCSPPDVDWGLLCGQAIDSLLGNGYFSFCHPYHQRNLCGLPRLCICRQLVQPRARQFAPLLFKKMERLQSPVSLSKDRMTTHELKSLAAFQVCCCMRNCDCIRRRSSTLWSNSVLPPTERKTPMQSRKWSVMGTAFDLTIPILPSILYFHII